MRKILIGLLIILLAVLLGKTIVDGFPAENLEVYGMEEIKKSSEELADKIEEVTTLVSVTYPQKMASLNEGIRSLKSSKERYLEKVEYSSSEEIQQANTVETYDAGFLWVILGNYATREGLVAQYSFQTNGNLYDIEFNLVGTYTGVIEFLYSVENDQALRFKIEDFALAPSNSEATELVATFKVKGVLITL